MAAFLSLVRYQGSRGRRLSFVAITFTATLLNATSPKWHTYQIYYAHSQTVCLVLECV